MFKSSAMIRTFVLTTVLVWCVIDFALAAPKIEFKSENVDFGKVVSGSPIKVTYEFKNTGDQDLQILEVKPSCGCTLADAVEKTVAAGKSSKIQAVFNSVGFNGAIAKSITVRSNDPDRPESFLQLTGQVIAAAKLKPETLNFGTLKKGNKRTWLVDVIPTDPANFTIEKVECFGSHISAPSFKKIKDKKGVRWQVSVLVTAGEYPDRVYESMSIITKTGGKSKLALIVFGNVTD